MSTRPLFALAALLLAGAHTARGQFDFSKLQKAVDTAKTLAPAAKALTGIGPEEEAAIGGSVAVEVVSRYGGLVRDETLTKRINQLGRALARYSDRPGLDWRFGVLASDTVNAFSAPSGYVLITRGLYQLCGDNDDLLAGVLAHEIAHITEKHALNIIVRNDAFAAGAAFAAQRSSDVREAQSQLQQFDLGVDKVVKTLLDQGFDPQTEYGADAKGRDLALTTGYAPGGLRAVLLKLQQRGGDPKTVFSTHPPLSRRLERLPNDPALTEPAATPSPTP